MYVFVYEDTLGIAAIVKILHVSTIQNEHVGAYTTLRAYVSISRCAT